MQADVRRWAAAAHPGTLAQMRPRIIITAALALALAAGSGIAAATVVIYKNDFSSRGEFRALHKFEGGKACRKFFRGRKSFGVEVKKGPRQCDFRTPVNGDAKEPDHEIEATATLVKSTKKGVRPDAYVGVALRADESSRYELRVFPDTRTWELRRRPGGAGFPVEGTEASIARVGKANTLKLRAFGDEVTAFVNEANVVPALTDRDPGELNGRKTMLVAGSDSRRKSSAMSFFGDVRIRLP
jgi:hypothetical protein